MPRDFFFFKYTQPIPCIQTVSRLFVELSLYKLYSTLLKICIFNAHVFPCLCTCGYTSICIAWSTNVHVEARGQPHMSFLSHHLLFVLFWVGVTLVLVFARQTLYQLSHLLAFYSSLILILDYLVCPMMTETEQALCSSQIDNRKIHR